MRYPKSAVSGTKGECRHGDDELAAGIDAVEVSFANEGRIVLQAVLALMRILGAGEIRISDAAGQERIWRGSGRWASSGMGVGSHSRKSARAEVSVMMDSDVGGSSKMYCHW